MKNNTLIIFAIVLLVLGFVFFSSRNSNAPDSGIAADPQSGVDSTLDSNSGTDTAMMDAEKGEAMEAKDSMAMDGHDGPGLYTEYDPSLLANADMGPVVLFFKAPWCPTCNALDKNISSNADSIPYGTTILQVDYDSSSALKKQYDVRTQHTMVQVDSSGAELNKWTGSLTLDQVLSQII